MTFTYTGGIESPASRAGERGSSSSQVHSSLSSVTERINNNIKQLLNHVITSNSRGYLQLSADCGKWFEALRRRKWKFHYFWWKSFYLLRASFVSCEPPCVLPVPAVCAANVCLDHIASALPGSFLSQLQHLLDVQFHMIHGDIPICSTHTPSPMLITDCLLTELVWLVMFEVNTLLMIIKCVTHSCCCCLWPAISLWGSWLFGWCWQCHPSGRVNHSYVLWSSRLRLPGTWPPPVLWSNRKKGPVTTQSYELNLI